MSELLNQAEKNKDEILGDIDRLVRFETYSYDKEDLDGCAHMIMELLVERLGEADALKREVSDTYGDTLVATYEGSLAGNILLVGHYDTVWPKGTLEEWDSFESTSEDGRRKLSGPGIFDMKTGLVQAIWSLKLLKDTGQAHPTVTFLINGDEELGSPFSRPIIEEEARKANAVFVLEASADGKVKVARKGVGIVEVEATGLEAHAGLEPTKGASAITAIMEYCLQATKLADPTKETTLNVGLISGGSGSNVVAGKARATIDIRFWDPSEQDRLDAAFESLNWTDGRAKVTSNRDWNRPPMQFTEENRKLYEVVRHNASTIGREIDKIEVGGASDANFVSILGIPVICGMGAVGAGAHARYEFIYPDEIPFFTALLASSFEGAAKL